MKRMVLCRLARIPRSTVPLLVVLLARIGRLDLSPALTVDRAVLVGVAAAGERGTAWKISRRGAGDIDAHPATATLCRIVIPLAAEPVP